MKDRLRLDYSRLTTLLLLAALIVSRVYPVSAQAGDASFLPTWKLLNTQEKQHFIAGYIHGWNDAARVTDVAIDFVRDNPGKAIDTLQKVKSVYDMQSVKPDALARAIDQFYADPDNAEAPLTRAISGVRERVQ
jgi:hypothetical protein